jgi:hypothetical protein
VQFTVGSSVYSVRVDGDLSLGYAHPGASGDIWASVFEKAYAYVRSAQNSYSSLNYGSSSQTFRTLGFSTTGYFTFDPAATLAAEISSSLAAGKATIVDTFTTIKSGAPLIASHSYSVVGVKTDASGNISFTLRNPWGFDGAGSDGNSGDGLVTISLAQFVANFTNTIQVR